MALTTNLINYWKFDGNNTDTAGSNVGTDSNVTYSTANGKLNQGAGFNGTTSKISLGTAIAHPTAVSVAAWVKWTSGTGTIFADSDAANSNWWGWRMIAGGTMRFDWANSNGNNQQFGSTSAVISDSNWHLLAVTQATSTSTPIMYVDTVSVAVSLLSNSGSTLPAAQGSVIGELGLVTGGVQWFLGSIDELGIWSRVLTSGEITTLYGPNGSGCVYPFTGNNNNMSLVM